MVHLLALLIFIGLNAACWFVSVASYRSTVAGPDPAAARHHRVVAVAAVGAAALFSFAPFPANYVISLWVWGVAAFGGLGLPASRAAILFAYLAITSFTSRLVVGGFMDMFKL